MLAGKFKYKNEKKKVTTVTFTDAQREHPTLD